MNIQKQLLYDDSYVLIDELSKEIKDEILLSRPKTFKEINSDIQNFLKDSGTDLTSLDEEEIKNIISDGNFLWVSMKENSSTIVELNPYVDGSLNSGSLKENDPRYLFYDLKKTDPDNYILMGLSNDTSDVNLLKVKDAVDCIPKFKSPDFLYCNLQESKNQNIVISASNKVDKNGPIINSNTENVVFFKMILDVSLRFSFNVYFTEIIGKKVCYDNILKIFDIIKEFLSSETINRVRIRTSDISQETTNFWKEVKEKQLINCIWEND